jgi:hypothetical protein
MPPTVAGSQGGPAFKSRRTSQVGFKIDSTFAAGLGSVAKQRREQDEKFILEEVSTADDATIESMATLFRSGTLMRAIKLAQQTSDQDDEKGELLAAKCGSFKSLLDKHLDLVLHLLEPTVMTKEIVSRLTRAEKKDLLCFALNLTVTASLPRHQDLSAFAG